MIAEDWLAKQISKMLPARKRAGPSRR